MKKENLTTYSVSTNFSEDDEAEFEGQEFFATTLAEEIAYHNLKQLVDADLQPKIEHWHATGFKQQLNSAIREYPQV